MTVPVDGNTAHASVLDGADNLVVRSTGTICGDNILVVVVYVIPSSVKLLSDVVHPAHKRITTEPDLARKTNNDCLKTVEVHLVGADVSRPWPSDKIEIRIASTWGLHPDRSSGSAERDRRFRAGIQNCGSLSLAVPHPNIRIVALENVGQA